MKIIFTTIFFLFTLCLFAQEKNTKDSVKVEREGKNEMKLNLFTSVLSLPEVNYERIFENNTSVGIAAFVGLKSKHGYKYGLISSYRVYFNKSEKVGVGFFIEVNAGLMSLDRDNYFKNLASGGFIYIKELTGVNYGMGGATGIKFLTKRNFVGEIFVGSLHFFKEFGIENGYLRSGITVGKRF